MPAHRSRTHRWRESLEQIRRRGGGLEFTLAQDENPDRIGDLVWRVKLLDLDDKAMLVEHPGALGHAFPIEPGRDLIGVLSVGQNRWMFRSRVLGLVATHGPHDRLRVAMPERVERISRRASDRTSLGSIERPAVDLWPLLDPSSVRPIEIATRAIIGSRLEHAPQDAPPTHEDILLPEVGPGIPARLANIGAGGVGLQIEPEHRGTMDHAPSYWIAIDLRPVVPAPLAMAARLSHTHSDSRQRLYAGMAFDFGRSPEHREFVLAQIDRYLRRAHPARRAA